MHYLEVETLKSPDSKPNKYFVIIPFSMVEGLDGGSGIHYSLKIWPIIHLIKKLGYSLK